MFTRQPEFGYLPMSCVCDHVHVCSLCARTGLLLQEGALWFFWNRVQMTKTLDFLHKVYNSWYAFGLK